MKLNFDINKGPDRKWRFRIVALNGEIMATSEPYESKDECVKRVRQLAGLIRRGDTPSALESKMSSDTSIEDINEKAPALDKSVGELTDEAWAFVEEVFHKNPYVEDRIKNEWEIVRLTQDFWDKYPSSSRREDRWKRDEVDANIQRRGRQWATARMSLKLGPELLRNVEEFEKKPVDEFVREMTEFFEEKRHWSALFDYSPQGRRWQVFEEFWTEKYPFLEQVRKRLGYCPSKAWFTMSETRKLMRVRLRSLEEGVYESITEKLVEEARRRNKISYTPAEIRDFLHGEGLLDTPARFQKQLEIEVNNRLKG
jgi:uncharacterized protein YegP (UPF0339 family)